MPRITNCLVLGLAVWTLDANAATVTVTSLADNSGSCPGVTCTLHAAITSAIAGDQVVFSPNLVLPGVINLSAGQLVIDRNLTIIGPGANRLTLTAGSLARVLNHTAGVATISGLRMAGGRQAATNGTSGGFGTGQAGMNGSSALGGCVRVGGSAQLGLMAVALDDCRLTAGDAGSGGSGTAGGFAVNGGRGGNGGSGGTAEGGAAWVTGSLALINSSITGSVVTGGAGGNGGLGGEPGQLASRGEGGDGGNGGAGCGSSVFIAAGGALIVRNSTLATGSIGSGKGGDGGMAGNSTAGGNGGAGGAAEGGAIHLASSATSLADLEFSTFGPHALAAGNGGWRVAEAMSVSSVRTVSREAPCSRMPARPSCGCAARQGLEAASARSLPCLPTCVAMPAARALPWPDRRPTSDRCRARPDSPFKCPLSNHWRWMRPPIATIWQAEPWLLISSGRRARLMAMAMVR